MKFVSQPTMLGKDRTRSSLGSGHHQRSPGPSLPGVLAQTFAAVDSLMNPKS